MLFVAINENKEPVGEPITETTMRQALGSHVYLPKDIKDEHIVPLGYACVGEKYSELRNDKDTLLWPTVVPNPNGDTLFTRTWELIPYPGNVNERVENRWREIREERNVKLAETDFAASDDYFYMKDEYVAYRNALRDITQQNNDPFLVKFPPAPVDPKNDKSLSGLKKYAHYKNNEMFLRAIKQGGHVETPFGFSVVTGPDNYQLIKGSFEMGLNVVYDTTNQKHELTVDQMKSVVSVVEQETQKIFERKKSFEGAIEKATHETIDGLIVKIVNNIQ